jgi:release factor glutamine methyltransferase
VWRRKLTYRQILQSLQERFKEAGIEEDRSDAWILFSAASGMDRGSYILEQREEMPEEERLRLEQFAEKRLQRIPVQHILGEQEFFGLPFYVNEHVLIPRQDTEILVEKALEKIKNGDRILDLCTGSGCILISLLHEAGEKGMQIRGLGLDLSEKALAIAEKNAERNGVIFCSEWIKSDMFEKVEGKYDMILSNPPYIPTTEIEKLMPEVKDHDPRMALDGDRDGLKFYRILAKEAPAFLKEGGSIFLEIGAEQAEDVSALLTENAFKEVKVVKDLAGLDRVICAVYGG